MAVHVYKQVHLRCSPARAAKLIATAICLRNCAIGLLEPEFGAEEEDSFENYDSDVEDLEN